MINNYKKIMNFCKLGKWLIRKKLFLFAIIYLLRTFLSIFGKEAKEKIFKGLHLDEIKEIVSYDSIRIIVKFNNLGTLREIFELKVYDHFKISEKSVVLDIGANIGLFTLKIAKEVKKVYSFEPARKAFEMLRRNVLINNLKNVKIFNLAVGDKNGYAMLYGSGGSASIVKKQEKHEKVKIRKLDELTKHIKKIDLIKMDVEGAEEQIILSSPLTLKKTKQIIMEVHPWLINEEKLINTLKKYFRLKKYPSNVERTYILYGVKK